MLPIPWDIINAGGIIIDNGLIVEAKANFVACTAKRRVMIKIICLELILGFSFLETNINIPELMSDSAKVKMHLSNEGAMMVTVESGLGKYQYIIPAQAQ